jgi:hypothetical protein
LPDKSWLTISNIEKSNISISKKQEEYYIASLKEITTASDLAQVWLQE